MKIEHLDKPYLQGLEKMELGSLRGRFLQVQARWFDDPGWPDCTQKVFLEKYQMLRDEMKNRGMAIPTKPIDRLLFAKQMQERSEISKPYPSEHACRLKNPDAFQDNSFRRTTREHEGRKYSILMGKLKGESSMTEQAYRYDKDTWTASEARTHCNDHDGTFEAAKEEKKASDLLVKFIDIRKDDAEERIVYGIVYEPDEDDKQGDWASEEEIRLAAYSFMESEQLFKINHSKNASGIHVLESFLAPVDFDVGEENVKKGSWVLASRINDDLVWEGIKKGDYTGYSMAGSGIRIQPT